MLDENLKAYGLLQPDYKSVAIQADDAKSATGKARAYISVMQD